MTSAAPPVSSQSHMTESKSKTGSAKHIPPNEVAWMFVQEYYTFVNKNPSQLHRFYTKNSSMVHGSEAIKVDPFNGQVEIHQKILELDFQDCKVCISNVDSLASLSGGIIVQVLGELSNKNGPSYKFAQTFFLAEQPGGYYVLNDIFRYLKDEVDFDYENESGEERAAVPPKEADAVVESDEIEKEPTIPSIPSSPIEESQPVMIETPSHKEESKATIERPASPVKVHTTPETPASTEMSETTAPGITEAPKQEVNGWGVRESSPSRPSPSAPAAVQKHNAPEGARTHTEKPPKTTGGKASPSTASGPAPKTTWATLAANDSKKWNKDNLAEVKGSVAHVSAPSNAKSAALPPSGQPQASAPASQGLRENKEKPRQNEPNASIYVKGAVSGVTRDMLIESFSLIGEVINCDVQVHKNCAFVDYATVESAQKAIAQGTFALSNGMTVHAEEKRKFAGNNHRAHNTGRGGYGPRGNSNYYRGDGSDSRGGRGRGGRSDMGKGRGGGGGGAATPSAEKAGAK